MVPGCQTEGPLVKIAYFISSYSSPAMVLRLTRTLRLGDPDGVILLHHDVHRSALDVEEFRRLGVVVFTSEAPIVWGDLTLEAVRWRIYRWVAREVDFDWLVLLSEQDYPVAPLGALKGYLSRADCDAVVETFDLGPESRRRYGYTYTELPGPRIEHRFSPVVRHGLYWIRNKAFALVNKVQRRFFVYVFAEDLALPSKVGRRRSVVGYREGFPAHAASAWFALSRRAVDRVVDFLDAEPEYRHYVERTIIPVESATVSILLNDPEIRVRDAAIHYARFSDPLSGRPDVLGVQDIEALKDSGHFFARKFSGDDREVFDLLDDAVLAAAGGGERRPSRVGVDAPVEPAELAVEGQRGATSTRRLLIVSSIRWEYLWQRHQALAVAAAEDGWQVDFLQPHPRTFRQVLSFPFRAVTRDTTQARPEHPEPPAGVTILGRREWLRPRGHPAYDAAIVYLPDRVTEAFLRRNGTRRVIYDAVVDWDAVPSTWFPPTGWRGSERRIAAWQHAAVTTDAEGMARVLAGRGLPADVIAPAADDEFLQVSPVLPGQRSRRALYFGSVRPEVDVPALVALRRAGVEVDVIGPVDAEFRAQLADAGIVMKDPVGLGELAALAAAYQVVLLPYRGDRAGTLMPAKFWNCVATGAWVVCLGLETPSLPTVLATGTTEEFVAAVRTAMATDVELVRTTAPTWHARWGQMLAVLDRLPVPNGRQDMNTTTGGSGS